jgi:predicted N-acetyltransferase YhbS
MTSPITIRTEAPGGALIRDGLARLRDLGARGCCLVGHPQYYRRFGFANPDGQRWSPKFGQHAKVARPS